MAATVHGCCGRSIYWDGIDFGQGVSSLAAVTYSQHGGVMEFRLDRQDGPVLARLTVPQSKGGNVDSSQTQIIQSPTGVHRVWVVFPGQDVSLYGWRP